MGKINGCIRYPFIFFNGLFQGIGLMMIYGLLKISAYSQQLEAAGSPGLGWAWLFAIGILGISILGVFAGRKENAVALKTFAGFMGFGVIIMTIFGILAVVERNEMKSLFESGNSETVKPWMDNEEMREILKELQKEFKCCGLVSAEDWGDDIPSSCECNSLRGYGGYGESECKSKPQGTSGPSSIYKQTCGGVIFEWIDYCAKIAMGICFGFAVTALLGLLMSLLMIHQIKRHDSVVTASFAMMGY